MAKVAIGNNLFYGITNGKRSYISAYRISHSMKSIYFKADIFWKNPKTGSELFPGITRETQNSALILFEPQLTLSFQINPEPYVNNVALRTQVIFARGKYIFYIFLLKAHLVQSPCRFNKLFCVCMICGVKLHRQHNSHS